jgi:hypothetical protein
MRVDANMYENKIAKKHSTSLNAALYSGNVRIS